MMTESADSPLGPFGECAYCGTPFRIGIDYPVVTRREDGELEIYSFCDTECKSAWQAED